MSNYSEFIKNLQSKPYAVRMRILVTTAVIATIVVIAVWLIGFKQEFRNLNKQSILVSNSSTSHLSAQHYTNIDGAEIVDGKLLVYFSAKNDTTDILNFSKTQDMKLSLDGKDLTPSKLTDRQSQPFVQKILSNSQNFGIATFDIGSAKSATITFDNLYFENNPSNIFKEQITFDPNKLSKPADLKN